MQQQSPPPQRKKAEWLAFIFLTVLLVPMFAIVGIGGYGLLIWIMQ